MLLGVTRRQPVTEPHGLIVLRCLTPCHVEHKTHRGRERFRVIVRVRVGISGPTMACGSAVPRATLQMVTRRLGVTLTRFVEQHRGLTARFLRLRRPRQVVIPTPFRPHISHLRAARANPPGVTIARQFVEVHAAHLTRTLLPGATQHNLVQGKLGPTVHCPVLRLHPQSTLAAIAT